MVERDRQPLTIQPDWLDDSLGLAELLVLARLDSYWRNKHTAYPSDDFLAQQTGRTVRTVQRAVAHLEELGWLSRETETNYQSRGGKRRRIFPGERLCKMGVDDAGDVYLNATGGGKVPATGGGGELKGENISGRKGSSSTKANNQEKARLIAETDLPTEIPRDKWRDYVWDRHERKKDMTELAATKAIKELQRLSAAGNDPGQVLDQSILSGWTGLFPVKTNGKNGHKPDDEDPFATSINRHRWEGP